MSTTDPSTTAGTNQGSVVLPPGASAGPARETSAANSAGQIVQGINVPVTFQNGGSINVFIPNTILGNVPAMQAAFDERIKGFLALPGQG